MVTKRKKGVIIFGTSGHAKICIDIFTLNKFSLIGLVAKEKSEEKQINGVPIIGIDNDKRIMSMVKQERIEYFIAIGDNERREKVINKLKKLTHKEPVNAIHPDACISQFATLGSGNFINCGVKINAGSFIANYTIINTSVIIDHDNVIEEYAQIGPGANLTGNVTIKKMAFIGTGAIIIPGIIVGAYSVIGAGACVIKDIPPHVTAVGCPAKVIKYNNNEG